jgi:hypothetical protein
LGKRFVNKAYAATHTFRYLADGQTARLQLCNPRTVDNQLWTAQGLTLRPRPPQSGPGTFDQPLTFELGKGSEQSQDQVSKGTYRVQARFLIRSKAHPIRLKPIQILQKLGCALTGHPVASPDKHYIELVSARSVE